MFNGTYGRAGRIFVSIFQFREETCRVHHI